MAPAEEIKVLEAVNNIHATMNRSFEKVCELPRCKQTGHHGL